MIGGGDNLGEKIPGPWDLETGDTKPDPDKKKKIGDTRPDPDEKKKFGDTRPDPD